MKRTEEYAYLVLKGALQRADKQGSINQILREKGIHVSEDDAGLIANYIERKGYGRWIRVHRGIIQVYPNMEAEDFVREKDHLPFPKKMERVYRALDRKPDKLADLEELLNELGIEYHQRDLPEYKAEFARKGYVGIQSKGKDGDDVYLTQKGSDYLHSPPWEMVAVPQEVRPDVIAVLEQMIAAVRESVQFSTQANQQIQLLFADFLDEVRNGNYNPSVAEKVLQTADQVSSIGSFGLALRALLGGG